MIHGRKHVPHRGMASSAVTVRRAGPADAPTVQCMVDEIAEHEGQGDAVATTADTWRTLLDRDDVLVLLAESGGDTVGYVSAVRQLHLWTGGDVLALDDLYVRPGHRDAGVGRLLMAALAGRAQPAELTIRWGVESDNHDAQRFYHRLGARLRHKVVAVWTPQEYTACVAAIPGETS